MNPPVANVICHDPPGRVDLRECRLNPLGKGQVLLEILFSAISPGTELRCLRGDVPDGGRGPFVPGYQSVGRILETGPACKRKPGEVVFNANGRGYGGALRALWGAHSSLVIADEDHLVDLPNGIDLSHASLAKLTAIALHGLRISGIKGGERVAVIGLGPLGQLSSRLASLLGAEVVAFDRVQSRVALAATYGLQAAIVSDGIREAASQVGWPEKDFDVIIDVTGIPTLIDGFIALARDLEPWDEPLKRPTRYVVQGSYAGSAQFDYMSAFYKELTFMVPRDHHRVDMKESIDFIASGKLDMASIIGDLVDPRHAAGTYDELAGTGSARLTAVFDWSMLS